MSHFGDYMDGVPVKISENYRRPPRIELPYSVNECPQRAQNLVENLQYCSIFEENVLSKVKELRSAKVTKKNERRHRLQLLEEAKQKKLDDIAVVEAQERLKQLSVSEVSYPSTDEISALSPDDNTDKHCDITPTQDNSPDIVETTNDQAYPTCSKADPEHNILQPIPVQSHYIQNNLLDDPDPLQELKMNTKVSKIPQYSNMDTLTFKDFENDTSSPFDNVELKTINDMELLAQVLQSQKDSLSSCQPQNYIQDPQSMYAISDAPSQANLEGMTYLQNTYMEQPIQGPSVYSPQQYPVTNGYYMPTDNVCDNMQMDNVNMYMPSYQYYVPPNPYPVVDPNYYPNQIQNSDGTSQNSSPYVTPGYYYQYPQAQVPNNAQMPYPSNVYNIQDKMQESASHNTIKSRSRSVPDIVKELNEEILMEKHRANERSYNASPAPKQTEPRPTNSKVNDERRSRRKKEQLPNPYDKLSPKMQSMCQKIHSMGFPLDRVARVCTLVGDNDKKIIEGLLLVNELMDLGFPEDQVSAALAKHEFNRDKALDHLVS